MTALARARIVPEDHHPTPAAGGAQSQCVLCYRRCELAEGEVGWCGARVNLDGQIGPTEFGVISCVTRNMRGYGSDPFLLYKPGATSLFVGGLRCSSACTFCATTNMVHAPDRVPWALEPPAGAPADSLWYGHRALLQPTIAVDAAEHWQCSQVLLGINEPTVTAEWTWAVASEAKRRGLDVVLQTNGFTTPEAIGRVFGPVVDAVDVGVKGSADPVFYDRHMRAPGAVPHVLAALEAWRDAGVYVLVGDVLAAPHMQDPAAFRQAATRFYGWVAETLGTLTPLLVTPMMRPKPLVAFNAIDEALTLDGDEGPVVDRIAEALEIAREVGLLYAHEKTPVRQTICCHGCGGVLLAFRERCGAGLAGLGRPTSDCVMAETWCPWWSHEQHVTAGRCEHCGVEVPVVALTAEELARERAAVQAATGALRVRVSQS